VKVETYKFDFAKEYQTEDYQKLYKKIEHHDISILVNNVDYADGNIFNDLSENSVHTMMVVNCYSIALLSKLVL
jgi:short-subunit dehydrogenase